MKCRYWRRRGEREGGRSGAGGREEILSKDKMGVFDASINVKTDWLDPRG